MERDIDKQRAHVIQYDAARRRVWILGQRLHHGATGAFLTSAACAGLMATRLRLRGLFTLAATGGMLMAHDWKDRAVWFARGPGDQP